jgi:hypothetical protein
MNNPKFQTKCKFLGEKKLKSKRDVGESVLQQSGQGNEAKNPNSK